MLIAERDLQVKDLLAVALEAEMSRLDDAGVNRTDRDLVDLFAFDPEEVRDADNGCSPGRLPHASWPGRYER